jgi:hypothetical protein
VPQDVVDRVDVIASGAASMPRICWFLGISIYMYWNDHDPPHFHATYNDYAAMVAIVDGRVIRGRLPQRVAGLVQEWSLLNSEALMNNWQRAKAEQELAPIVPLE